MCSRNDNHQIISFLRSLNSTLKVIRYFEDKQNYYWINFKVFKSFWRFNQNDYLTNYQLSYLLSNSFNLLIFWLILSYSKQIFLFQRISLSLLLISLVRNNSITIKKFPDRWLLRFNRRAANDNSVWAPTIISSVTNVHEPSN